MLKLLISTLCLTLLISGCQSPIKSKPIDPNLPKMPYSKWYISGRYPHYFYAKAFSTMIKTQSNKYKIIDIDTINNKNYKTPGQWQTGFGFSHLPVYSDLPKEFFICWVSFADQTFYRTKLVMPLWARQEMVKAHHYYSEAFNKNEIGYNDTIIIGFAPGGSVTGWVTGNPQKASEAIEFGKGVTERIPQGSDICPNPYIDGKIPEITDEAKAWLKKHGMPKEWQEKYNNVTMGQYLKLKNPARF